MKSAAEVHSEDDADKRLHPDGTCDGCAHTSVPCELSSDSRTACDRCQGLKVKCSLSKNKEAKKESSQRSEPRKVAAKKTGTSRKTSPTRSKPTLATHLLADTMTVFRNPHVQGTTQIPLKSVGELVEEGLQRHARGNDCDGRKDSCRVHSKGESGRLVRTSGEGYQRGVDDVNKQMRESIQKRVELNRAAEVEKRQVNERLARLEAASFELLTAAFAQVKSERGEYEEELGKRQQEAHRMLIPSQTNRPISTLPPARETPNLAGPIEAENPPTSTRNIVPLPQRKEISTGQSSANGKFEGWGGFNPKDPTAVVEDHLLKEFDGVETAVTSAINVLLSGTHGELPDKIADVNDDGVPMGTHQQELSTESRGDNSSPVATPSKAAEGRFADTPIILGDSSEKAAESAKGTSD